MKKKVDKNYAFDNLLVNLQKCVIFNRSIKTSTPPIIPTFSHNFHEIFHHISSLINSIIYFFKLSTLFSYLSLIFFSC